MAKNKNGSSLQGLLVPLVVIALWEGASRAGWINPQILPSPWAVLKKWGEYASPLKPYDP